MDSHSRRHQSLGIYGLKLISLRDLSCLTFWCRMYIPVIANKWFERFMLGVAGASTQFVRHTNLSECCVWFHLRSILNVILWVNLVRGMPGCTFFVVKSHRPLWNFRMSICLLREILWKFMFIVRSEDDGDDRIATINLSESALRIYCKWKSNASIWVYAGAGCTGYNERLQSMLWMKSLDVVTLEAMCSRDLSDER